MGWQPGRGKSEFLLQGLCALGWICAGSAAAHKGAREMSAGVAGSCGRVAGKRWIGVTTVSVGRQPGREKSEFLLQGPCALG